MHRALENCHGEEATSKSSVLNITATGKANYYLNNFHYINCLWSVL